MISGTGTDRALRWSGNRIAGTAAFFLLALALLCVGARTPDEPAVAGRPSLSAVRATLIAVVPDRTVVATRPFGSAGNRHWLAAGPRDRGVGALPVQTALATAAADAAIAAEHAGRAGLASPVPPHRPSASSFEARAPPAAA